MASVFEGFAGLGGLKNTPSSIPAIFRLPQSAYRIIV